MLKIASRIVNVGLSAIIETHFYPGLSEKDLIMLEREGHNFLQIYCYADLELIKERHRQRVSAGARPFIDHANIHDQLPSNANWIPLDLPWPLLRLDTSLMSCKETALRWIEENIC